MATYSITVAASAARTATGETNPIHHRARSRGVHLVLDITAASGTAPTLDVKVQRYDETSGKYVDLPSAQFAQKTTTGTDDLIIYPGIAETANRSVSDCITETWKVIWTVTGTTPSFTFSIGARYIY